MSRVKHLILKPEIIDLIKVESELFQNVAKALKISHYSLPNLLRSNSPRLTQATVMLVLRTFSGFSDEQMLTEAPAEQPPADIKNVLPSACLLLVIICLFLESCLPSRGCPMQGRPLPGKVYKNQKYKG